MGAAPPSPGQSVPASSKAEPTRALIDARGDAPWRVVGGISLVTRLVRSLELEGMQEIAILCDAPKEGIAFGARLRGTRLERIALDADASPAVALANWAGHGRVLAVDGSLVVDRRLLRALRAAPDLRLVPPAPGDARVGLALLDAREATRFGAAPDDRDDFSCLYPASLPAFSTEMRGEIPILHLAARTADAARAAERALVRATQKHVMDAPARWLDPPIENALVTRLAPTAITPNQITVGCTLLGFVGAWLLWRGEFLLALPVMYLVGWLDGVDGKLARLRLHYSPMGAGESYFDFAYENAWWIALAAHFANAGNPGAVGWGVALVAGNLLDEIAYTVGHARLDVALDLLSPADGAFRLIAGRRNIYAAILLVATLLGAPYGGLVVMGGWAVTTGVIHTVRLVLALRSPLPPGLRA